MLAMMIVLQTLDWMLVLKSILVGLIGGLVLLLFMISKNRSVQAKHEANDYIRKDSLHLWDRRDVYLYRRVEKERREQK